MLRLLKIILAAVVGVVATLRAVEEGVAIWIRRETRPRDLGGLAPA